MTETVLLLLTTEADGSLGRTALESVAAAQSLGTPFTVGLIGGTADAAANTLAACGASRFIGVSGPEFAQSRYATDAAAAEAIVQAVGPTVVLAPATTRLLRALPGVAQRVGGRIDTHVVGLSTEGGALKVSRWFYRQRIEANLSRAARPWFIVVDGGIAAAYNGAPGTAAVETVAVELPVLRTEVVGIQAPQSDQQTIRPDADVLFVAGAGWTKKQKDGQTHTPEAAELILDFVKTARASLGSSKSLVDMSGEGQSVLPFLTHLHQVGQTGATPRHPKGLATCCHGEEPHVVGWRFINDRRAVNLDANCGWARGKADVLYVADAFEVMRKVNELISAKVAAAAK